MQVVRRLCAVFGIFFVASGCTSFPLAAIDITLVRDSNKKIIIPGILPTAVEKGADEINVFSIHGIGNTSACFADPIIAMFSGLKFRTPSNNNVECKLKHASAMPVCLVSSYDIAGEAFRPLADGDNPIVIGEECESGGRNTHYLAGIRLKDADIRPRRMARMGTLFKDTGVASYIDKIGNVYRINVNSYAYWWHGDANAIQAPFVSKDLSEPRTKERVALNRGLKKIVMNEGLIDATFFLGKGGALLKQGTQNALCRMILDVEGIRNVKEVVRQPCGLLRRGQKFPALEKSQVVLLTQSLGSRILFDSMSGFFPGPGSASDSQENAFEISEAILSSGPLIYMSANQLPLLGVAEVSVTDRNSRIDKNLTVIQNKQDFLSRVEKITVVRAMDTDGSVSVVTDVDDHAESSLQANTTNIEKQPAMKSPAAAKPVKAAAVVSFYDPNDLLGYPAADHFPPERQSKYIDVQQRYAIPWFIFANPANAHDKSFNRNRARRMILCGALQESKDRRTLTMNDDCRK